MLRFLSSLTFLYAFSISLLVVYGIICYRQFAASRKVRKWFPGVFLVIALACLSFLYINFHAPLHLKTFSNLDHHFLKHEGFNVHGSIALGGSDTANKDDNSYNSFVLHREEQDIMVSSSYSEEPFYLLAENKYRIASTSFPALGHALTVTADSVKIFLRAVSANAAELVIAGKSYPVNKEIRKGVSAWNLFRDQPGFITSAYITNDLVINILSNIYLLRDDVSRSAAGELRYFISGRIFKTAGHVQYDSEAITLKHLAFEKEIPDMTGIAWGIAFLDNNKNQFIIRNSTGYFEVLNKFPVSYPLSEERSSDNATLQWTPHDVTKFLVADPADITDVPAVFPEGFLFSPLPADRATGFSPVLIQYRKAEGNRPLAIQINMLEKKGEVVAVANNQFTLPARSGDFSWRFAIQDSFDWKLGGSILTGSEWQLVLFGAMAIFILLVFFSSLVQPAWRLSLIWQLLSCVTLVLLTTRFFLYWRYKSFPPFEGMDLPSLQQLNTPWNFYITILVTIGLAVIFGFDVLKFITGYLRTITARMLNLRVIPLRSSTKQTLRDRFEDLVKKRLIPKAGTRILFFSAWLFVLAGGAGIAALSNFDPTICRHLAIGLVLLYFVFIYVSYRHSPLVAAADKSWWKLRTTRKADILLNNPVKVLLSVSLLALFVFVDIGFAIVFLNFLIFNEAFLCINYAIAGLSAGSRRNASVFGIAGAVYMILFVINLTYGPLIFKFLLGLPQLLYTAGYVLFSIIIAYTTVRLLHAYPVSRQRLTGLGLSVFLFTAVFLFFPKQRILDKAAMTRYRIDVMAMPASEAIENAYAEGKNYTPVIRAAQNQWFINTFIDKENNPAVNKTGFQLLPHAPQNKGARYNAQATDLVSSRFIIAEHGKWPVMLYVLLLMLPTILLASFYKLYPDFTNRVNAHYPVVTAGFSLLNYLLISALLVILAATGRYIFFGQDLPFGSILSKQSVLFPAILIIAVMMLLKKVLPEQYPSGKKLVPGLIVFAGLGILMFFFQSPFNRNREFGVDGVAKDMDSYIQARLQPIFDHFDSSGYSRRLPVAEKDRLFTDSVRTLIAEGYLADAGKFFQRELEGYTRGNFTAHLDQDRMLFLDLNNGKPQLAVNDNFFRIDPPPHLQQYWSGNVYGDTSNYNITRWNASDGAVMNYRVDAFSGTPATTADHYRIVRRSNDSVPVTGLYLVNRSQSSLKLARMQGETELGPNDSLRLRNPERIVIRGRAGAGDEVLLIEPDAFMKNYFVNGSRYYVYPAAEQFIWARNFSESVSSSYTQNGWHDKDAFISLDAVLMDSLNRKIRQMMASDDSYKQGAEYGIAIADANGRMIAMSDFINGLDRPDPNDKTGFNSVIQGENGLVSQSLLRKQIGNINLLRMNPGPGSTLKPIIFSAIASQLNLDWDAFAAEGFSVRQQYFGGEKVGEYDFEKNNGRITSVKDYLRLSDNYYHANLLLLGSYSRQGLQEVLAGHFATRSPEASLHWPYFSYKGKNYWLDGFENWPGFENGKANFGSDSSFVSTGLVNNFGVYTYRPARHVNGFSSGYDSLLFRNATNRSGFLMPEYALFDQKATGMNRDRPNEIFLSSFRGHVKGSSQVMIPPVKMTESFGRLVSQNRNYSLTLNPYAEAHTFQPFHTGNGVQYATFLRLMKESVFTGMEEALYRGTAAGLGAMLKKGSPYYYYAKTGTTGDDESKEKSKLFVIIISEKDITAPGFNFRDNKFYTVYFTSQKGPAKQNEKFQAAVIRAIERSTVFRKYMSEKDQ